MSIRRIQTEPMNEERLRTYAAYASQHITRRVPDEVIRARDNLTSMARGAISALQNTLQARSEPGCSSIAIRSCITSVEAYLKNTQECLNHFRTLVMTGCAKASREDPGELKRKILEEARGIGRMYTTWVPDSMAEFCVLIPEFVLNHESREVAFGPLVVVFDLLLHPRVFLAVGGFQCLSTGYFHPHVNPEGTICEGELSIDSDLMQAQAELYLLLKNVHGLLKTYNPRSPHVRLEQFRTPDEMAALMNARQNGEDEEEDEDDPYAPLYCVTCEIPCGINSEISDHAYRCVDCHQTTCTDCGNECQECLLKFCDEHYHRHVEGRRRCPNCGESTCRGVTTYRGQLMCTACRQRAVALAIESGSVCSSCRVDLDGVTGRRVQCACGTSICTYCMMHCGHCGPTPNVYCENCIDDHRLAHHAMDSEPTLCEHVDCMNVMRRASRLDDEASEPHYCERCGAVTCEECMDHVDRQEGRCMVCNEIEFPEPEPVAAPQ